MFSQLRLHGGSNHYLLPTSLLQAALIDASPSNAFAGGVVRVEATKVTRRDYDFATNSNNLIMTIFKTNVLACS